MHTADALRAASERNILRPDSLGLGPNMKKCVRALMRLVVGIGLSITAFTTTIAGGNAETADGKPALVDFHSGELDLKGFLWKPAGDGPFPAILWNHGSEKRPGAADPVAQFFVARGYVFFVPHRRGQGRSPGPYIMDQLKTARSAGERSRMLVKLHETQFRDQLAALTYLKGRPFVDQQRLAVMGFSFGGIQTMLAVERGAGYRVAVNCSGAAETWEHAPDLRRRLSAAARNATMPVFFLQARNDYDLAPNRILSEQVKASGKPTESKVYPAFGAGAQGGHSFCMKGVSVWGPDVTRFIEAYSK
ncbi:MAG: prolyl oligopeptidase family serine peptidase [Rhodomicrobiaceae bacterium]